ncbi:MAG: hypothetical protein QG635_149 [Bacteroidota bacterium]|nr:hypothetical protein [Bacteroidota bacterium]
MSPQPGTDRSGVGSAGTDRRVNPTVDDAFGIRIYANRFGIISILFSSKRHYQ